MGGVPHGTIAFVPLRYGDEVVGGAETLARNLAEELHRRGWPVEIITTCALDPYTWEDHFPPGEEYIRGIKVTRFPVRGRVRTKRRVFLLERSINEGRRVSRRKQEYWISNVTFSEGLYRFLEEHREDYRAFIFTPYLFGTTYTGMRIARERGLVIPCLHDEPYARLEIFREMMRRARGILFNSEPEMELARRLYGEDIRGMVVGMGFDDFSGDAERFRAKFDLQGDMILYCGRRERAKNTPLLLRYFCNYLERSGRDLKLVLTGAGEVSTPYAYQEHIVDLGYVSERDKLDAYSAASVLVHPSVNESFSIIVLEAWLAGTPCLVHGRCAVNRHHVERSQGGLWFEDWPHFYECLDLLLRDRALARRMGEEGRSYVLENYSWDRVIENFERALDEFGL